MKKILLIGATGAIGQAVAKNLGARHQLVTAGRSSGDHRVDLTSDSSVAALLDKVGKVDAIISAAGNLHFGPITEMTAEQFNVGLQDKLLGQVRLALQGQRYLNDGGSITLTAGVLSIEPIRSPTPLARSAPTARSSRGSKPSQPNAPRWPTSAAWRGRRQVGSIA